MQYIRTHKVPLSLIFGDVVIIAVLTLYGFANHKMLNASGTRMAATLIPWAAAWMLVAPFFGIFNIEITSQGKYLWRPLWAMIIASPFAGLLRAAWLGNDVVVAFVVVFGGFCALGITAWRVIYFNVSKRWQHSG